MFLAGLRIPITWSLLIACLAVFSSNVHAQHLPVKVYTTADGLGRDQINRIVQDSHGFLWFCTSEGLSRFDGYKFTNYTTANGLPSSIINDFLEMRDGTYLVATTNGLCRFNPRGSPLFSAWRPTEKQGEVINVLLEDHAGNIWCGTNAGLYLVDRTTSEWRFKTLDLGLPRENFDSWLIESLIEDQHGTLWIGTRGSGLCRYSQDGRIDRFTVAQGLPSNRITALLQDRNGRFWVGTPVGLCRLVSDPNPKFPIVNRLFTIKDGLCDNWIGALFQLAEGLILVGSKGFSELVATDENIEPQFRSYTRAEGLTENNVQAIAQDRDGNLWIGTTNGGALKIARNGFRTFNVVSQIENGEMFSLFRDQKGETCAFLRDRHGHEFISYFDGQRFNAVRLKLPPKLSNVGWGFGQQVLQDITGDWWTPTGEGLFRFKSVPSIGRLTQTPAKAIYGIKEHLVTNDVFTLFEDSKSDIWVGSISPSLNGLTRWSRSNQSFNTFTDADGLPSTNVLPTAFGEDRYGNLWVGFHLEGVARYDSHRFAVFTKNDGAPEGWIRAIYSDRGGRLWISSAQDGVRRIDDPQATHPTFIRYTVSEGLSSDQVNCITEDQWGRLYFCTGRGVDRLDPTTGRIKHFTASDGLVAGRIRYALRDDAGALWFANETQISRLIPEPDRPQVAPQILIEKVQVAGVASTLSELGQSDVGPLKLSAAQNEVSIDFVGLEFDPGELLRYQHKLEGMDHEWSAPSEQRTVNYESLAPGSYHFLVRAITTEGVTSSAPAVVSFIITPPFWRQWWFSSVAVLLTCLMIYVAHRYRVSRLLELERVRTRIASDLHDDIGSSLSQMAILSEVAKQRLDGVATESVPILSDIAQSARVAVDAMSDIVWAIDPRRDDLKNVVFRVRQFASDSLGAKGIKWSFDAPAELERTRLDPEQRRQLFLIFKEAITNAVRHADCSAVRLSVLITHGELYGEIRDDGHGFIAPPLERIEGTESTVHGLSNVTARARQLGGDLKIESSVSGTLIRLMIPLKKSHGINMPWMKANR